MSSLYRTESINGPWTLLVSKRRLCTFSAARQEAWPRNRQNTVSGVSLSSCLDWLSSGIIRARIGLCTASHQHALVSGSNDPLP